MARKQGQIIARGPSTWLVRIYQGRDPQTGTRKYLPQTIRGSMREARRIAFGCFPSPKPPIRGYTPVNALWIRNVTPRRYGGPIPATP